MTSRHIAVPVGSVSLARIGREPALAVIGVLGPTVAAVVMLIPDLTWEWQTAIQGLTYALAGLLTALVVHGDRLAPALLGLAQAVLSVVLAAGVALTDGQQTAIMTAVSIVVAAFVRQQVSAPVPPADPQPVDSPVDSPPGSSAGGTVDFVPESAPSQVTYTTGGVLTYIYRSEPTGPAVPREPEHE